MIWTVIDEYGQVQVHQIGASKPMSSEPCSCCKSWDPNNFVYYCPKCGRPLRAFNKQHTEPPDPYKETAEKILKRIGVLGYSDRTIKTIKGILIDALNGLNRCAKNESLEDLEHLLDTCRLLWHDLKGVEIPPSAKQHLDEVRKTITAFGQGTAGEEAG